MNIPWIVQQLVAATQQLHASRIYERFSDHDCFLIRTPKLDEPAVAVLMGYGGETFGLNVFIGPSAMASYQSLFSANNQVRAHRTMLQSRMLGYQMSDALDLTFDARRWLKKAKVRISAGPLYPDPMSIEPGKVPSAMLKDPEARLLLHLVRGILAVAQNQSFKPCGINRRGQVLCVQLDADTEHPKADIAWEHFACDDQPGRPQHAAADQITDSRFDLADLATHDDNWLISLLPVPGSIQGDDRQPHILVVCSEQSQSIFPCLLMETEPANLVDALARLMCGEYEMPDGVAENPFTGTTPPPVGLPARLICDCASLCDAIRGAFAPRGIECLDGSDNPNVQAMLDDLHASFETSMFDNGEADFIEEGQIPAADDLAGWKQVDGWLKDMIHDGFDHDRRYRGARAMKQYFGPDVDHKHLFQKYRRLMIVDCYAHWFATSYRSARNRPTLAEQWLDDPATPDAVKVLLRAVIKHAPCIYRVAEADEDTGKIDMVNLFTGDVTIVTDFALSTCLNPGLLLSAKLVPVGDFHFLFAAGPLMSGFQLSTIMAFFDHQKIALSPKQLRDHPYLLGWLWDVIDQQERKGIDLRNTDGHVLMPHTAVFICSNQPALERFLADQPDYEPEGDDPNTWVWFRQGTDMPAGKVEATHQFETHHETSDDSVTLLGRIELDDGRFTLTTNSRERFDTARAAMEQVEGVKLKSVKAEPIAKSTAKTAADTAPPAGTLTDHEVALNGANHEDALDAARAYITKHYRRWLDLPLPALHGKTPRQAAKDPHLRQQLAVMVRAMPDPVGMGDDDLQINAPRQMLLAELGLD